MTDPKKLADMIRTAQEHDFSQPNVTLDRVFLAEVEMVLRRFVAPEVAAITQAAQAVVDNCVLNRDGVSAHCINYDRHWHDTIPKLIEACRSTPQSRSE